MIKSSYARNVQKLVSWIHLSKNTNEVLELIPQTSHSHPSILNASSCHSCRLQGHSPISMGSRGLSSNTSEGPSATSQRTSRLGNVKSEEQAAWAAQHGISKPVWFSGKEAEQSIAGTLSRMSWGGGVEAVRAIPSVPRLLGFSGLIPFIALSPALMYYLGFPEFVQNVGQGQVAYGALIVSFLGAVHWGIAMTSTFTGARALMAQRERYAWSVFPSLAAWPTVLMEPGPGSFCVAFLLGICYMSDRAYAKTGSLPAWYMTLRGHLTITALISMLATTAFFLMQDIDRAVKRMEEDDKRKAAMLAERDARDAALAASAAAANVPASSDARGTKRGWW